MITHKVGNCNGLMLAMDMKSVDVIMTSPPYGLGLNYDKYEDTFNNLASNMSRFRDNASRVLKEDGSLFMVFGGKPSDRSTKYMMLQMFQDTWVLQNEIIWVKSIFIEDKTIGHYKPINSPRYLNDTWEFIWHFTKQGNVRLNRKAIGVPYSDKTNVARYGNDQDVHCQGSCWFIPYATVQSAKDHPATFPEEVVRRCLLLHGVNKDSLVLDPFQGTGTTGVVCKELGCNYIGMDISDNYTNIAKERTKDA